MRTLKTHQTRAATLCGKAKPIVMPYRLKEYSCPYCGQDYDDSWATCCGEHHLQPTTDEDRREAGEITE
jgi:hypothetical protein